MKVRNGIALALAVVLGLGAGVALSAAARRPAQAILSELDALRIPGGILDDAALKELLEVCRQRTELEKELFDSWPGHARVPSALSERWALLENTLHEHERVLAETEAVLARKSSPRVALSARRARAWSSLNAEGIAADECLRRIDAGCRAGRDDDWSAAMLVQLAAYRTADPKLQRSVCQRVTGMPKLAPDSKQAAQDWLGLVDKVGQPLALGFDDAGSGTPASIAAWKGSPVLVHVRRASDWEPLEERDLRALEVRHRASRLVVAQVMVGRPETASARWKHSFVVPDDDPLSGWATRFGIRKTPFFLLADAAGTLIAVSQALPSLEHELGAPRP